ncbi:MAG: thioredoxin family protein [Boseongicola sp.]|jgi:thiol-disulfide isomerase/thioredoxin|nr:thioredoxin family protein [Boseongicola sp.]NNJ68101.1 thioredoxin family protein [Boseongicola sp.]
MHRRTFLTSAAALTLASPAFAGIGKAYTPGLVQKELDAGKTVFVDFYADWCTTCRRQERVINALLSQNTAYEENISFVAVDWDKHSNSELSVFLNIPRRSTLVVLRGDEELGRIVAGTRENEIKALLDTALVAATS